MGYFSLRASPPGKAILSDALVPSWLLGYTLNGLLRAKTQKRSEMVGARFGQASIRRNASSDSRSRVHNMRPRSTPAGNQNKSTFRSQRTWLPQACRTAFPRRCRWTRIRFGSGYSFDFGKFGYGSLLESDVEWPCTSSASAFSQSSTSWP